MVPTGNIIDAGNIKLNKSGTNLVLPTFYSSYKNINELSALRFLKVKKFFSPIRTEYEFNLDLSRYLSRVHS
jgi:hypothetical protein